MILSYIRKLMRPWDKPGRYASLYERGGRLYVAPQNRTDKGRLFDCGPVSVVDPADGKAVTDAIKAALALSKTGVPLPDEKTRIANGNPVRKAAGGMEWPEFVQGTKHVSIADDGRMKLLPFDNKGASQGFVAVRKSEILVAGEDDLPAALNEAFAQASAA